MKSIFFTGLLSIIILLNIHLNISAQEKIKIAVVPKGEFATFWKSIKVGVKLGATALSGVEILWLPPSAEDNIEQQISIVEQCIENNVSGILLSPIHHETLVKSVVKAVNKNIPVVIFDSQLKGVAGKDYVSFVGINNRNAGKLAGEHLAKLLNGRGNVVLLRYIKGQANTTDREDGLIEALANYKNIQLTVKDHYSGGKLEDVKEACRKIIDKLKEADGIFCPNEISTTGMLHILREANLSGKKMFVGFDTPPPIVDALKKGEINALVAQDPPSIGFHSIKTLVDNIRGKKVSANVDIDIQIVTKENLNNPEIQKLLALPIGSE